MLGDKYKKIEDLFKSKKYKYEELTINNFAYYNPDNITEKFVIKIVEPDLMEVEVPLYNTNYSYISNFSNLDKLYNYLLLHI
jgi:hypothetical protein|tara:strand:+ start:38 stop:283 length:246 start_codon:yes stop_codon:yes gene_type:complete